MSNLLVAEVFFDGDEQLRSTGIPGALLADGMLRRRGALIDFPQCSGDVDAPAISAFVNHGRWMVSCPFGCGSAQVASETDHRFFCTGSGGCANFAVDGKAIPVVWPDADTQSEIEELLMNRPPVFRNWQPWEPVEKLALENIAKGDI